MEDNEVKEAVKILKRRGNKLECMMHLVEEQIEKEKKIEGTEEENLEELCKEILIENKKIDEKKNWIYRKKMKRLKTEKEDYLERGFGKKTF